MSTKVLIKLASRGRPLRLESALDNAISNIEDKDNTSILVSLDKDDETMRGYTCSHHNVKVIFGRSKSKIDAINRDISRTSFDYLVNFSDDMWFVRSGFDNIIRKDFEAYFPNGGGFLHYPDGHNDHIVSMSVIDRKYYESTGKVIYNPQYRSFCCDNEAKDVAIYKGAYKFISNPIFVHLHPDAGKSEMDDTYARNFKDWNSDVATYKRRKQINFGL